MNEEDLVFDKENHGKQKLGYEPFTKDIVLIYDNAGIPSIMYKFSKVTNKEQFGGNWYNPLSGIFNTSLKFPRNKRYIATGFRGRFTKKDMRRNCNE